MNDRKWGQDEIISLTEIINREQKCLQDKKVIRKCTKIHDIP
jgi:hypothetical protein